MLSRVTQKPAILIVDDEPSVLTAITMALEEHGWELAAVGNAQRALYLLKRYSFDLVLADKNLPDMDGTELIRRLRERDSACRVIMMTGYATVESALETSELGIDAYVKKPFGDIAELPALVRKALGAKRLGEQRHQREGLPSASDAQAEEAQARVWVLGNTSLSVTVQDDCRELGVDAGVTHELSEVAEDVDLLILCAASASYDVASQARARLPHASLVIVSDELGVESLQQLVALGSTAVTTASPSTPEFRERLEKLIQRAMHRRKAPSDELERFVGR